MVLTTLGALAHELDRLRCLFPDATPLWASYTLTSPEERSFPMVTRCKFRCTSATPKDGAGPHTASFTAVTSGSPENEQFFSATPGGSLSLSVVRQQHFEVGKEYYLDITPAS